MVYEAGGDGVVLDTLNTHYETRMGWFLIHRSGHGL